MTAVLSIMSGETGRHLLGPAAGGHLCRGTGSRLQHPCGQSNRSGEGIRIDGTAHQGETVISEEALPVFGYTWFKVERETLSS